MLPERVSEILSKEIHTRGTSLREQMRFLKKIEEEGILPPAEPQTFYKCPVPLILNRSVNV